ncbi:hypothetical protein Goarm_012867 [Gossypium armourianum]|uniref:Uncharacterized protein n=2 Tax=Gossypium TaxID=3633 RepID=A0A7J9J165_9ROSI|nr:hypothetical protein [Gossypium lobatum]MBA0828152.1 hypothetical protein [Gossypium armourianum]
MLLLLFQSWTKNHFGRTPVTSQISLMLIGSYHFCQKMLKS